MRRLSTFAAIALAFSGMQALACDGASLSARVASADEHRFWVDFWADLDPRESQAEFGYYVADLKDAWLTAADQDCASVADVRWTKDLIKRRLAAVQAKQLASGGAPHGR